MIPQKLYVQVGVTAMREPNGDHLPSVPLYIEVTQLTKAGFTKWESDGLANIAGFFIRKLKESEFNKKIKNGEFENDKNKIPC